jgi:hypothetical protein
LILTNFSQNRSFYSDKLVKKVENRSSTFLELNDIEQKKYLENILVNLECYEDDKGAEIISIFVFQTYFNVSELVRNIELDILRRYLFTEQKIRMRPESLIIERYPLEELTKSQKISHITII